MLPAPMDVRCERCKTEYEFDDARITEAGVTVKCTTCGHVFKVKKKALVVTVPVKPDATEDERFALREGDIFPNALTAVGEPWKQPRVSEVAQLSACMDHGALAKDKFAKAKSASELVDYQALAAEEALDCRIP